MMAVDVEGEMARFVTKTLRVCSGLVVVIYWPCRQRLFLLLLERKALIIEMKADSWHREHSYMLLRFLILMKFGQSNTYVMKGLARQGVSNDLALLIHSQIKDTTIYIPHSL